MGFCFYHQAYDRALSWPIHSDIYLLNYQRKHNLTALSLKGMITLAEEYHSVSVAKYSCFPWVEWRNLKLKKFPINFVHVTVCVNGHEDTNIKGWAEASSRLSLLIASWSNGPFCPLPFYLPQLHECCIIHYVWAGRCLWYMFWIFLLSVFYFFFLSKLFTIQYLGCLLTLFFYCPKVRLSVHEPICFVFLF